MIQHFHLVLSGIGFQDKYYISFKLRRWRLVRQMGKWIWILLVLEIVPRLPQEQTNTISK